MDKRELLKQWHVGIRTCHIQHMMASNHNAKMHKLLGVPVVIIGTIVGTSVFASLDGNPDPSIKILVGMLSVSSAILAALQTFMGFSDLSEKHKFAAVKYGMLRRELEQFISMHDHENDDGNDFIEGFRERWDKVDSESPGTPQNIHERALSQVRKSFNINAVESPA